MAEGQARLKADHGPKDKARHVWQIDFTKPTRSTCACGAVRQARGIGWADGDEGGKGRAKPRRKAQPAAAPKPAGTRQWKRGVKG